jgi:hypothetical protein
MWECLCLSCFYQWSLLSNLDIFTTWVLERWHYSVVLILTSLTSLWSWVSFHMYKGLFTCELSIPLVHLSIEFLPCSRPFHDLTLFILLDTTSCGLYLAALMWVHRAWLHANHHQWFVTKILPHMSQDGHILAFLRLWSNCDSYIRD